MNSFLAFLVFLTSTIALAQTTPCYWSGNYTKCYPSSGIFLDTRKSVFFGDATTNYVELKAGSSVTSYTLTLPTAQGSSNTFLKNNGSGTLSWSAGTPISIGDTVTGGTDGSILLIHPAATLAQDNSNLFWDATNHRLGVGTTSPASPLSVGSGSYFTVDTTGVSLKDKRTVRLYEDVGNGTNYVEIKAAENTTPSSWTLTLPADQGSIGKVLYNADGSGVLGWTAAGASTADLNAVRAETSSKQAVDLVCHSNITLSGTQTCDGQSTFGAARVLAMAQTDVTENGIWINDDFLPWTRPSDFPTSSNLPGSLVTVTEQGAGTSYQDTLWFGIGDGSSTANFRLIPTTASNTQLTASRALATDSNSHLAVSATTATELGYVSGVSSAIQTQLDAKTTNPMTTTGDIIYASNTATPASAARLAVGGANTLLHGGASVPAYSAVVNADISGAIGITHGGTGQVTKAAGFDALSPMTTAGDIIYGGTAGTGTRLAIGSATTVLHGGASTPAYSAVVDGDISGQVGVAHGGTGIASGTSGGIPYFSGTTTIASSGALAQNGVVIGGGAGATPTTITAGTNGQLLVGVTSGAPAFGSTVSAATTFSGGVVFNGGGTNLNYYEEGTHVTTWSWNGSGSTTGNTTLIVTRIGRLVTIVFQTSIRATTGTSSTSFTANTVLPSQWRPSTAASVFCAARNNAAGIASPGFMTVGTDGSMVFFRDPTATAFTNSADAGLQNNCQITFGV